MYAVRQPRFTSPSKGEAGSRSEPTGGRDPLPAAFAVDLPFSRGGEACARIGSENSEALVRCR
jgi:hypothetical protein